MLEHDPTDARQSDVDLLVQAAQQAAEIALRHYRGSPQVWQKEENAGPVSEADLEVDAHLRTTLSAARPDYGWLSEETPDTAERLKADFCFIIDPIDGTRAFVKGDRTWGHSLAIAHNGAVVAAVVFMPVREKLYTAALGRGAALNGAPIEASGRAAVAGGSLLGNKHTLDAKHWPGGVPDMTLAFRSPMAYRLACLAEGRFDAMATFNPIWEWDLAAGALLVAESGHEVTDQAGAPLVFNAPHPRAPGTLAANPTLHAELVARR